MQEYVKDRFGNENVRTCALESSFREFAVQDTMHQHNGQFGQRVHVDPSTVDGRALMHSREDGWMHSCTSNVGWGVPISGKKGGRQFPRPHISTEQELDNRGH
eukprot:10536067-Karenia_brevis.AAC.1